MYIGQKVRVVCVSRCQWRKVGGVGGVGRVGRVGGKNITSSSFSSVSLNIKFIKKSKHIFTIQILNE